jgi:hypothetical protein
MGWTNGRTDGQAHNNSIPNENIYSSNTKDRIARDRYYTKRRWPNKLGESAERMEDQRILKILFKYNPIDKRDPGRSQKRWKN